MDTGKVGVTLLHRKSGNTNSGGSIVRQKRLSLLKQLGSVLIIFASSSDVDTGFLGI